MLFQTKLIKYFRNNKATQKSLIKAELKICESLETSQPTNLTNKINWLLISVFQLTTKANAVDRALTTASENDQSKYLWKINFPSKLALEYSHSTSFSFDPQPSQTREPNNARLIAMIASYFFREPPTEPIASELLTLATSAARSGN